MVTQKLSNLFMLVNWAAHSGRRAEGAGSRGQGAVAPPGNLIFFSNIVFDFAGLSCSYIGTEISRKSTKGLKNLSSM